MMSKESTAFLTKHPETRESEVYLGNFTSDDAQHIGWRSKRAGVKSYCTDGSAYPQQAKHGVLPYFADKHEVEEGLRRLTA